MAHKLIEHGLCWHRDYAVLATCFLDLTKNDHRVAFSGSFACQYQKITRAQGPSGMDVENTLGNPPHSNEELLTIDIDLPLPLGWSSEMFSDAWSSKTNAKLINEVKLFHEMGENEAKHVLLFDRLNKCWTKNSLPIMTSRKTSHISVGMAYAPPPYVGTNDATLKSSGSIH